MLHVHRSNKTEALVALLAGHLAEPGAMPADPFTPLRVVVGAKGMERWLRHQIAGLAPGRICANVAFPFPNQVLDLALQSLEARFGLPGQDGEAWSPEVLAWAILDLLPDLLAQPDDPAVAPLRAYLATPDPVGSAAELSLAQQLASVFARYVATRPELAVAWSEGRGFLPAELRGSLAWQPRLWALLEARLAPLQHSAQRWHAVRVAAGASAGAPVFDQPLRVFGVSNLPPPFLQRLGWLAQHDEIHLYVLCASDHYWADLASLPRADHRALRDLHRDALPQQLQALLEGRAAASAHPLLRSLGRVGRDLQIVLQSLDAGYEDSLFVRTEAGSLAGQGPPEAPRLLRRLQADLRELLDPGALSPEARAARAPDPADDSLQLHACYGPMRQVQALRQALLHLFARHPDLEPRDVLVMCPDLEAYVPLVGAVFDQGLREPIAGAPPEGQGPWGAAGAPAIPYQVAERSLRRTNPVAEVLLRCLELASPGVRLSATAVLDLLSLEPFRLRFGLQAEELELARGWIRDSGVRWAVDASDRAEHGQPASAQNTWRQGLERLALGVTMADDPQRPLPVLAEAPLLPYDAIEGGTVVQLGRFFDAVTTLQQQLDLLRQPRSAAAWLALLLGDPAAPAGSPRHRGSLAALTATTPETAWLEAGVRGVLLELQQAVERAGAQRGVTVQALATALAGRFELVSGSSRVQTGAVTFSAMVPYRSVPYRVVCLLGMDEGAFPSNPGRLHFDLTHRQPRVGDRDPRDEDRHLLLEALLSARDHFLVFFTGRDPRSNEPRPPAVPIGELCEVLDLSFPPRGDTPPSALLTRQHPLQPFSPRDFQAGSPWSFDPRLLAGARLSLERQREAPGFFTAGDAAPADEQPEPVDLQDLVRFFRNPTRHLLQRGLGLHLWDDTELLEDREPVDPAQVDAARLAEDLLRGRQAALRARLEGRPVPPEALALQRIQARGELPLGSAAPHALAAPRAMAGAVMQALAPWLGTVDAPLAPLPGEAFSLELSGGLELRGQLPALYAGDLVAHGFFGEGPWSLMEPWLLHLAQVAVRPESSGGCVLAVGSAGSSEASLLAYALEPQASPAQRQAAARAQLAWLVELYQRGQRQRIPLLVRCSYDLAWFLRPGQGRQWAYRSLPLEDLPEQPPFSDAFVELLAEARRSRLDPMWSNKESTKPHERLAWGDEPPFDDPEGPGGVSLDFVRTALRFWQPLMLHRRTRGVAPTGGEL